MPADETKIYLALLIAAGVLGVILVIFIITLLKHQRSNRRLYHSKILAEITTLEKERQRIATDLHDELAPLALLIRMDLDKMDLADDEHRFLMDKSANNLDNMLDRMRGISNDLMPVPLVKKGLIEAMETVARNFSTEKMHICFSHENMPEIPNNVGIHLYRIMLEVIQNTIKHAEACELLIEMGYDGKNLKIYTDDDGIGFNPDEVAESFAGLGLRNLYTRTEILEGKMYLDSAPETGTRFTFEIPFKPTINNDN